MLKDDKIIVCLQREIEKTDKGIIESQEKGINIIDNNNRKIHNKLVIFIIKELHNL